MRQESILSPDWLTVTLVLGGVLVCYYLVPVAALFLSVPLGDVIVQMSDPSVVQVVATSLVGATISTVVATVFGVPLSYWLSREQSRRSSIIVGIVVLPLVLPPIVSGMVLHMVFGPSAPIGRLAAAVGVQTWRSLLGVVLAQTFVASPFVVVTSLAAFSGVDPTLEAASRSLGKGRLTTVYRITLPLAMPGIVAGMALAFARAMGEFGATMIMAYHPETMPVRIWLAFSGRGVDTAFPIAILLVLVSVAVLVVLNTVASNPWT
ncbi:ABC transporter permease [Halocatena pleomorpha]|uniref:ABC transporter permease subunit n=1 Tax=Halocatena pleomorpha TaxID=1785090 RepID=A0A3P3RJJ1_9EURY|nr:ABC transporter permease subunit [Halocatena pleomorpha]RRJ33582.1 ABC transporter permease subunit [Halocatena pleomorpha]